MANSCIPFWFARLLPAFGLFLAGCSGGSADGGVTGPIDFAAYQVKFYDLQNTWAGISETDPTTLPVSGSANYAGIMQLALDSGSGERSLLGNISIISNFSTDSITGSADEFVDINDNLFSGSLVISGGVLNRGANTAIEYSYAANLDGVLDGGGDSFAITGDIFGDFLGPDHLATSGVVSGTAVSSFGTGYVFGSFLAEQ